MNSIKNTYIQNSQNLGQSFDQLKKLSTLGKPAVMNKIDDHRAGKFGQLFANAIQSVNQAQKEASSLGERFVKEDPSVSMVEMMMAQQKSSISFQAAMQTRNKLLQAYQEVLNMPL